MPKSLLTCAIVAAGFTLAAPAHAVDLIGVHDLAMENDPILQAASYRRDATGENERQAWANLLPNLGGSAGMTRGDSETSIAGDRVSDTDVDNESWGLSLQQVLYDQSNYERLDLARGQVSQSEAIYQQAYQNFLVRVSQSYFSVLTASDQVVFAEAEERALQRQFEQAEQRFEVGLTAITDVHESRASYDNARARAIVARNRLADAREGLRELTGQYFEEVDPLQEELPLVNPDPNSSEEWAQIALQSNPSIIASQYGVEIADANARLQRSGHFPTLGLEAGYSNFTNNNYVLFDDFQNPIGNVDLENTDFTYGLRLTVPIYQGGAVSSRTRQARYELNATQEDLDQQQRAVLRDTRNAYRAVIAGIEQVQAFNQALVSAQSALEATQAGFEVGTRTIVDVLLAQQRYYGAQGDNSLARHDYILSHLQLKAAGGMLSREDLAAVNTILD
ncbi:TolC family outer membrane protein [Marinihelvus fidelis]|nr:TolC family outer membrane protein [Marinihelvus fidelis]